MKPLPYVIRRASRFAAERFSRPGGVVRAVLLIVVIVSGAAGAHAQDNAATPVPTPTPTEEERQLLEEKRLTELRRDIELAKKAIRDAQPEEAEPAAPPTPTATPLAGDTTLENVKLEPEMISYRAMSDAAFSISKEIKEKVKDAQNIAIYDAQVIKDWRFRQALFPAFQGQVEDLSKRYRADLCTKIPADFPTDSFVSDDYIKTSCSGGTGTSGLVGAGLQTAFAAGTNLLKSFIDLTALFRTETKIQGVSFTVEESALVAELFRALRNQYGEGKDAVKLYYPEVFPPRLPTGSAQPDRTSTVVIIGSLFLDKAEADDAIARMSKAVDDGNKKLKAPSDQKGELEAQLARIKALRNRVKNLNLALAAEAKPEVKKIIVNEIGAVKSELASLGAPTAALQELRIKELEAAIEQKEAEIEPIKSKVDQLQGHIKLLTTLGARFLTFIDESVKVGASGTSPLALFIKAEDLDKAMPDPESYWLEIKSVSAGGNNRTRKNLIRFFTGAKLDHSGGIIVEYTLYDNTGAVVYSDKLSVYDGYLEPKKIRDRKKFKDRVGTVAQPDAGP